MSIYQENSEHKKSEKQTLIHFLAELTKNNPVLTRTLLVLLTTTGVYAAANQDLSNNSAQEVWAATNSSTDLNGTVPLPTAEPQRVWDQYRFSLKDENGVTPEDAWIKAFFLTEEGEQLIFTQAMEKGQDYHVAGITQDPGEVVKFELTTASDADLRSYDGFNNPIEEVVVTNPETEISKAIFEITAAEGDISVQESDKLTTLITTTVDTIGRNRIKVELDNPTTDSSIEVEGLVTGTVTVDVATITENVQAATAAGVSAEGLNIGTISGNAPEGMSGTFTLNGETYVFDSQQPFLGTGKDITVGQNSNLEVDGYNRTQSKIFAPYITSQE
jgi:hypothetical protein